MKPRGDFQCIVCQEVYELPLGAAACPDTACGGLLERRFTTAPAVLRGVDPGREPVTAQAVETAAAGDFDHMRAATQHKPEFASKSVGLGSAFGMLDGAARTGSRQYAAPTISLLRGRNPTPGPGSKTA